MLLLTLSLAACGNQNESSSASTASSTSMQTAGHKMTPNPMQKVSVKKPKVPFKLGLGMKKFQTMCSKCHGEWGGGTEQGPPLMHPFYKPSHHGDPAFYNAALKGVKAHHWKFGDMPAVAGTTPKDVSQIIGFVRWLQKENGIY
jgi:hypothetical protein